MKLMTREEFEALPAHERERLSAIYKNWMISRALWRGFWTGVGMVAASVAVGELGHGVLHLPWWIIIAVQCICGLIASKVLIWHKEKLS
jgi:hypothetical protein